MNLLAHWTGLRKAAPLAGCAFVLVALAAVVRTEGQAVPFRPNASAAAKSNGASAPAPAPGSRGDGAPVFDEEALSRSRQSVAWIAERRPFAVASFAASPAAPSPNAHRAPEGTRLQSAPIVELQLTGVLWGQGGWTAVFEDRGRGRHMLVNDGEPLGSMTVAAVSSSQICLQAEGTSNNVAVGERVELFAEGNLADLAAVIPQRLPAIGARAEAAPVAASGGASNPATGPGAPGQAPSAGPSGLATGPAGAEPAADEAMRRRIEELRARRTSSLERTQRRSGP